MDTPEKQERERLQHTLETLLAQQRQLIDQLDLMQPDLRRALESQTRLAKSVGSLALQLGAFVEKSGESFDVFRGLLLAQLAEARSPSVTALTRLRKDSGDITDSFVLPGNIGSVAVSRRTQRVMIAGLITAIGTTAYHLVALIFGH